jgi:hypothetical protein
MRKTFSKFVGAAMLASGTIAAPLQSVSAQDAEATGAAAQYVFSEDEDLFLLGTAIDIMFHEGGHMVIDVFSIPILGQEEDAADNFATLALLSMENELASNALMQGINGWYLLSAYIEPDDADFFGLHDLGVQRASRKVCHLIASEPDTFGSLAQALELDQATTQTCGQQFTETLGHWGRTLEEKDAFGTSEFDITYNYGEATPELQPYRAVLENNEMLQFVAQYLIDTLKLPREITVTAETCGEANAFYDPGTNTMTFCYEFAQLLHGYYAKMGAEG